MSHAAGLLGVPQPTLSRSIARLEAEEADTVRGMAGAGLDVALLPAGATESLDPDVVAVRISEPRASRTVGLAWMADRPATAPAAAFRDFALSYQGRP